MNTREYTSLPFIEKPVAVGRFGTGRGTINKIVIHTMIGTTASASSLFASPAPSDPTKISSAHYGVSYDGTLTAWLEEYYTAYHSGNRDVNFTSIGIEHEDMSNYTSPRPDALYKTSAKLVADICKFYNIPCDRNHILKHNEIVATGCPHNLDIGRIVKEAQEILTPQPTESIEQLKQKINDLIETEKRLKSEHKQIVEDIRKVHSTELANERSKCLKEFKDKIVSTLQNIT